MSAHFSGSVLTFSFEVVLPFVVACLELAILSLLRHFLGGAAALVAKGKVNQIPQVNIQSIHTKT